MFKDRAIFLLVISAILIPLIFIANEIVSLSIVTGLFIIAQIVMLYLFYKEQEAKAGQWLVFWSAILSLAFMLLIALTSRTMLAEFLGLLIFLLYFITLLVLLFRRKASAKPKTQKTKPAKKDDLQELAEFFEPDAAKDIKIVDLQEPRIENIFYEEAEKEKTQKAAKKKTFAEEEAEEVAEFFEPSAKKSLNLKKAPKPEIEHIYYEPEEEESEKGFGEELPRSEVFDYKNANSIEELNVRELQKVPAIDFEKVKQNLDGINDNVKTISQKIREISEKAIKEGEETRKIQQAIKKMPKPKKKEMKVFASKTGKKFHYKKDCLALKRVRPKDVVLFSDPAEAKKKGLKACNLCR